MPVGGNTCEASAAAPVIQERSICRLPSANAPSDRFYLAQRFIRGVTWHTLAVIGSRGMVLLAMFAAARLLGRERTGQLGMLQSTLNLFGVLAMAGLGVVTTRVVGAWRTKDPLYAARMIRSARWLSLWTASSLSLLCFISSPWLASSWLGTPELLGPLIVTSAMVFCTTQQGVFQAVLNGCEAFRWAGLMNLLGGLALLLGVVSGAACGGLLGTMIGMLLAQALHCLLSWTALRAVMAQQGLPWHTKVIRSEVQDLLRQTLPLAISTSSVIPAEWLALSWLSQTEGGYSQTGLYSAASQWFNALMLIPLISGQVALPVLSERWQQRDRNGFVRVMGLAWLMNLLLLLPLVLAGSWWSKQVMGLMGVEFIEGAHVLTTLLLALVVIACQTPVGHALHASGRSHVASVMNLAWAGCYLGLASWWLPAGAVGIARARLGAYCLHTVWVGSYVLWQAWRWQAPEAHHAHASTPSDITSRPPDTLLNAVSQPKLHNPGEDFAPISEGKAGSLSDPLMTSTTDILHKQIPGSSTIRRVA
ncbi:MAG: hypothetical protein KatS3mg114_1009 [Planctomycetaceae bacterium]|nr:MAG: hypothetical protein KatS3mg114_1009 [Planctomycetaceae bacterium]